jgi:putative ABC transport system permease protein
MIALVLAFLRERRLTSVLNVLLLGISVAMLALLLQFARQSEERFLQGASGVDLVVGAKGSPLQLVLSSVYQLDQPTGNIPLAALATLRRNPMVASALPLALGDNFENFRIVGTEPAYLTLQNAHLASGRVFEQPLEVVMGADVAAQTGAGLGQRFFGSHGLGNEEGQEHDHAPFTVVGILAPSGSVADRLILTSLESVWDVHGIAHAEGAADDHAHEEHEHAADLASEPEPEITAILVRYRNAAAALRLPAMINRQTNLLAASPAVESTRLLSLFDVAIDAIGIFAWLLAATGGLAIFVALYNAVRSREGDLALLRVMGASRGFVFATILVEGLIVAALGAALGLGLAHALLWGATQLYPAVNEAGISALRFYREELLIAGGVIAIGALASLLPAARVYRTSLIPILNAN